MAMAMVRVYEDAAVSLAAMPVIAGRKSRLESFAGADTTYTIEAMMGDGRALQARELVPVTRQRVLVTHRDFSGIACNGRTFCMCSCPELQCRSISEQTPS